MRELQPIATQRHGVYHPFGREQVAYNYERNPADPRIVHKLYARGRPARPRACARPSSGYARRTPAQPEQGQRARDMPHTELRAARCDGVRLTATASRRRPSSYELSVPTSTAAPVPARDRRHDDDERHRSCRSMGRSRQDRCARSSTSSTSSGRDDLSAPLPQGHGADASAASTTTWRSAFPATLSSSRSSAAKFTAAELTRRAATCHPTATTGSTPGIDDLRREPVSTRRRASPIRSATRRASSTTRERLSVVEEHTSAERGVRQRDDGDDRLPRPRAVDDHGSERQPERGGVRRARDGHRRPR